MNLFFTTDILAPASFSERQQFQSNAQGQDAKVEGT